MHPKPEEDDPPNIPNAAGSRPSIKMGDGIDKHSNGGVSEENDGNNCN